jgi:CcmD family protein
MKKNLMYKSLTFAFAFLLSLSTYAQDGMEEYFYQSGKIKVVVAVAAIVLAGIFVYLFMLDKKVTRLEKKHDSKNK